MWKSSKIVCSVMNMMRSMLEDAGMPKNIWAEAVIVAFVSKIDLQVQACQLHMTCG